MWASPDCARPQTSVANSLSDELGDIRLNLNESADSDPRSNSVLPGDCIADKQSLIASVQHTVSVFGADVVSEYGENGRSQAGRHLPGRNNEIR